MSAAARHRRISDRFTAVVDQVGDWRSPTPVDGWVAEEIVDHLTGWVTGFLGSGGVELDVDRSADDPAIRWRAHFAGVQSLLESTSATEQFSHPMAGSGPLGEIVDRIYTTDILLHTWDLARSAGVDHGLDPEECEQILVGMQSIEELLRSSGQYGPAVPVEDTAPAAERLAAFIGRDPGWTSPG